MNFYFLAATFFSRVIYIESAPVNENVSVNKISLQTINSNVIDSTLQITLGDIMNDMRPLTGELKNTFEKIWNMLDSITADGKKRTLQTGSTQLCLLIRTLKSVLN